MYDAASPNYRGRCTAPLLVDKRSRRLVCNESSDIVRMLNSVSLPGTSSVDLYPAELAAEIDLINETVHNNVRSAPIWCLHCPTMIMFECKSWRLMPLNS